MHVTELAVVPFIDGKLKFWLPLMGLSVFVLHLYLFWMRQEIKAVGLLKLCCK